MSPAAPCRSQTKEEEERARLDDTDSPPFLRHVLPASGPSRVEPSPEPRGTSPDLLGLLMVRAALLPRLCSVGLVHLKLIFPPFTRPSSLRAVVWDKHNNPRPWEHVKPNQQVKLVSVRPPPPLPSVLSRALCLPFVSLTSLSLYPGFVYGAHRLTRSTTERREFTFDPYFPV